MDAIDATTGIPPAVTEETEPFWAAAAEGRLVVERCASCGAETFPPRGICHHCRGRDLAITEITGPGEVYSYTVDHQRWLPDLAVPYAMVLVEFPDHPGVRVAGRLRGCAPAEVAVGMPVEIGFQPGPGGFHIPSFVCTGAAPAAEPTATPAPPPARPAGTRRSPGAGPSTDLFERKVVISGVGQSAIGRQVDRSGFQLTLDAILAAVADAGLTLDDIDGLAMYPGGGVANLPGYSNGSLYEVQDALRLRTTWRQGLVEGMSLPFYGPAQAVATGAARHVVIWRTVKEGSAARNAGGRPAYGSTKPVAEGPNAWLLPIGMLSPVCQIAPYATRYMHEYGVTREQLAWLPVTQRAHAALNPDAVYRSPLTVEDYLAARVISSPICLFDCDVPADGATAIVVSAAETARDLRAPVRIEAMAGVVDGRPSWEQWEDMGRVGHGTAAELWARTDLRPADVDVAQLYDGFTIEAVWWLEAMGFCGVGEAGSFVEGGKRIALDGELPLNTWGGQLSGGRLHAGFGHTAEAVRQLRGEAGERQVRDARVAAVTNVGGIEAGAALLTTW
ncbi:thiolase C-terminal domain-containing protein [Nocardia sp. BMG111209]|uniref:thiolase C-terminal domain-containing protein n=1 Tax=Nocardia sp. BMG111209 TaxID=1160137 RepID=UPI000368A799|nr:OB-fold domain-containing protein [Nocardia sp. BMG111209]